MHRRRGEVAQEILKNRGGASAREGSLAVMSDKRVDAPSSGPCSATIPFLCPSREAVPASLGPGLGNREWEETVFFNFSATE